MDRDRIMWVAVVAIAFTLAAIAAAAIVGVNAAETSDDAFADAYESSDAQWGGNQYAYGAIDTLQSVAAAGMPVATNVSSGNDSISECLDLINDIFEEIARQNYVKAMEYAEEIYRLAEEADYVQFRNLVMLAEETVDMDRFDRIAAQLPTIIRCFEEGDYEGAAEAHASIVLDMCMLASEFKELSKKWNDSKEDWHFGNAGAFGPVKAAYPDERAIPVAYGPAI